MTPGHRPHMPTPGRPPSTLQRADIVRRIPHQHSMCLLDRVTAWDARQIQCEADSHRSPTNPMRAHGRLGASCGIEYAAQAMAVHGALTAESLAVDNAVSGVPVRGGYLVSVRNVSLFVEQLDTVAGPLTISAERVSGDTATVLYSFAVLDGMRTLLSGRAIVVLDPPALLTGSVAARIAA